LTNALITAVDSMQNDLRTMETVSQNMVNISTPGYRRAIPVARNFDQALLDAGSAPSPAAPRAAPAASVDLSQGVAKQTGRALDLAILGDGYFEIATPEGPAYTRAGDFALDARGRLVTQAGFAVQGMQGDLVLNGPGATVERDGRIMQEGQPVGQIKLVRFADASSLHKTVSGLLQTVVAGDAVPEARAELQAGYLEGSNVTPMREMVAMMETTRHFESAQKLYQGYDEMLGSAIQKLGQF
jgi:flagellar basal-body rod protein FlgF